MRNTNTGKRAVVAEAVEPSEWQRQRESRVQRLTKAQLHAASASLVERDEKAARWYCLAVRGGHEFAVEKKISEAGVEIFVPSEHWSAVRKGRKIEGKRAFMPGYALVRIVPSADAFCGLTNQKDVVRFVGNSSGYHIISNHDVTVLKSISDANNVSRMPVDRSIGQGVKAHVEKGIFAGHDCVVLQVTTGRDPRARVWVEAFGEFSRDVSLPLAFLRKL